MTKLKKIRQSINRRVHELAIPTRDLYTEQILDELRNNELNVEAIRSWVPPMMRKLEIVRTAHG